MKKGVNVFRTLVAVTLITLGVIFIVSRQYYASSASIIAGLYGWVSFAREAPRNLLSRIVRTFGPSLVVLTMVLAAGAGLPRNLAKVDFGMFYSSALLLRQDPSHLYDSQRQTQVLHAVTQTNGEPFYLPFAYPPIVAALFVPLSLLTFRSAYYVMFAVNAALLAFTLRWLSKNLSFRRDQVTALVVLVSAALPVYAVFVLGHLTFVGLLLISLFATDIIQNKNGRAGLWAGLMLFKPTLFPIPLLMLLWKRQWQALAVFLGVGAGLLMLSLALVGWTGLRSNFAMLRLMTSDYLLPRTHSLRSLAFFLGQGEVLWIALVAIVVAILWIAVAYAPNQRWVLACALFVLLLIPPYLQFYDLSLGLVSAAVALSALDAVSDKTRNLLFLIVLVPGVFALAVPREQPMPPVMPVLILMLFFYCLWKAFSSKSQPSSVPVAM